VERDAMEIVVRPAELEQFVFELLQSAGMEPREPPSQRDRSS
jgi:hypothetical protein